MNRTKTFAVCLAAILPAAAWAGDYTWTGGGSDNNWTNPANWGAVDFPQNSTDNAYFDASPRQPVINSNVSVAILGVTGTSNWMWSGASTLTLYQAFNYGSSGSSTCSVPLSGTGTLAVSSGILRLAASNTFTGGITVSPGGQLNITTNGGLGTGAVTLNRTGGQTTTLRFGSAPQAYTNPIVIGGSGGTVYLKAMAFTTLAGGTLDAGESDASFTGTSILEMPSVIHSTGIVMNVMSGAVSVAGAGQLFSGNLNLAGGILVLNGASWTDFKAKYTGGYGTSTNLQWQISGGSGGFGARGTDVTIDGDGIGTINIFDRDFCLGSTLADPDASTQLYASGKVAITQDIALNASVSRTWTLNGNDVSPVSGSPMNRPMDMKGPVHEISGIVSGGAAARTLKITGAAGNLRIGNANNTFQATFLVQGSGGMAPVVIFSDDGAFGNSGNTIRALYSQGQWDTASVPFILLENSGGGTKTFSRSIQLKTGDSFCAPGWGSYQGNVLYTGIVYMTYQEDGRNDSVMTHVQGGTLILGAAGGAATFDAIRSNGGGTTNTSSKGIKNGPGELVLNNVIYTNVSMASWKWVLYEGTLTSVGTNSLRSDGTVNLTDMLRANTSYLRTRSWRVVTNDHLYTNVASGSFGNLADINVEPGITLTMYLTNNCRLTADQNTSVMTKSGQGTWIYSSTNNPSNNGNNGYIQVDQGVLDVSGDLGNTRLRASGGTILSGPRSSFTDRNFEIDSDGGKIGISATSTDDVVRGSAISTWTQTSSNTVVLAARDNYNLAFTNTDTFPAIGSNTTLRIARDGTGAGEVRINNTNLIVYGAIGGNGILSIGKTGSAWGTGALTLTPNAVFTANISGAGSYDQLVVSGKVSLAGATVSFNLGYVPQRSDVLYLMLNSSADPINGTFLGIPEGGLFTVGTYDGRVYVGRISYTANVDGTANDIAISGICQRFAGTLLTIR